MQVIKGSYQYRQLPFEEITLWQMFNCFADGLAVMERGGEYSMDGVGNISSPARIQGWDSLVHFDIKPMNSKSIVYL